MIRRSSILIPSGTYIRFGARMFLGVGMLINSAFGFLVPVAAEAGWKWLILVRFIQGLGEVNHTLPFNLSVHTALKIEGIFLIMPKIYF